MAQEKREAKMNAVFSKERSGPFILRLETLGARLPPPSGCRSSTKDEGGGGEQGIHSLHQPGPAHRSGRPVPDTEACMVWPTDLRKVLVQEAVGSSAWECLEGFLEEAA